MVAAALTETSSVPIGAPVHDIAGKKVGRVVDAGLDELVVERGWLRRLECTVAFADVDRYERGRIVLKVTDADVRRACD